MDKTVLPASSCRKNYGKLYLMTLYARKKVVDDIFKLAKSDREKVLRE